MRTCQTTLIKYYKTIFYLMLKASSSSSRSAHLTSFVDENSSIILLILTLFGLSNIGCNRLHILVFAHFVGIFQTISPSIPSVTTLQRSHQLLLFPWVNLVTDFPWAAELPWLSGFSKWSWCGWPSRFFLSEVIWFSLHRAHFAIINTSLDGGFLTFPHTHNSFTLYESRVILVEPLVARRNKSAWAFRINHL